MHTPHDNKQASIARASSLLKAVSNKTRLTIVCNLAETEMSVGELLDIIPLSQSAMSQHLALLRREKSLKPDAKLNRLFTLSQVHKRRF